MKETSHFLFVVIIISIISASMFIIIKQNIKNVRDVTERDARDPNEVVYSVYTPGCKMPTTDVHKDLIKPLKKPEPIICKYKNTTKSLILSNHTSIWINKDAFSSFGIQNDGTYLKCCYVELYRPETKFLNESDHRYKFKNTCETFTEKVVILVEFIMVNCSLNNETIYKDFFAFVPLKESVENRSKELSKTNDKLNVLMLGIDAISRTHFHRTMKKTADYLVNEMKAIEMMGFNKVFYNTLGNLITVTTGRSRHELAEECWTKEGTYLDDCRFIWNDFKEAGYRTAFIEDSIYLSAFNYEMKGFLKQPTDYYLLHYLSAEYYVRYKDRIKENNPYYCSGSKLLFEEMLEYIKKFVHAMQNLSYFGIFWSCSFTHDEFNYSYLGDDSYLSLLKSLSLEKSMKRTVLIVLSDHGFQLFNDNLNVRAMQLESRQPLMYFVFPAWFHKTYLTAVRNLRANVRNLVTNYDLHETMKDLLNYSLNLKSDELRRRTMLLKTSPLPRGISLFLKIPKTRTCKDAGIKMEFCSCAPRIDEQLKSPVSLYFAEHVVRYINEQTINYSECVPQSLSAILDANIPQFSNSLENISFDTRITVKTSPGDFRYEATAINLENKFMNKVEDSLAVIDSVRPLDVYKDRGKCMYDYNKQPFCVCKF